ncbi:hypothetical protein [Loigolactobacillus jiayinensis]|uniref:Uncharacterized protein n=1 Tax=Loigolactobacillus jiayinensis TaxID=2486016 RepID=A0ABW1RJ59_9LACO|nr:hypothetical protein [Loigolactobacillus jiayinensis]
MNKLVYLPQMIQIGSTGRNSGKTVVAKKLIQRFKQQHTLVALKIITITGARGKCQRGGVGCGICTSIDAGFELIEETNHLGKKDTMELLKAGCQQVFLLKAFKDSLLDGFKSFLAAIPDSACIICESNSIRDCVRPGIFLMLNNQKKQIKPTAASVYDLADLVLTAPTDQELMQINIQETMAQQLVWATRTA